MRRCFGRRPGFRGFASDGAFCVRCKAAPDLRLSPDAFPGESEKSAVDGWPATAEQLAALGMTVLIGARDPRRGEEAAAAVHAAGGDAHAVPLDVTTTGDGGNARR